jgi:hypothetical protein
MNSIVNSIGTRVLKRVQKLYNTRLLPRSRMKGSESFEDIRFLAPRCAFRLNDFQCNVPTKTDEIQMLFPQIRHPTFRGYREPAIRSKNYQSELKDNAVPRRGAWADRIAQLDRTQTPRCVGLTWFVIFRFWTHEEFRVGHDGRKKREGGYDSPLSCKSSP